MFGPGSLAVQAISNPQVEQTVIAAEKRTYRCVYFFAGPSRRGDVKFWLERICAREELILEMAEFDLLRKGPDNDLAISAVQEKWLNKLESFNGVLQAFTNGDSAF